MSFLKARFFPKIVPNKVKKNEYGLVCGAFPYYGIYLVGDFMKKKLGLNITLCPQMLIIALAFLVLFLSPLTSINAQSVTGLTLVPQGERWVGGGEFSYDFSPSSGPGIGLRAQKQIIPEVQLEGGGAFSSGKRERNLYLSLAKTFYPDYGWQPALTLKGFVEFTNMDDDNYNQIGLAPIFSKGVRIVEQDVYFFAGLPARLIIGDDHTRDSRFSLGVNTGGTLPLNFWKEDFFGTVEMYFNARKSYNSLSLMVGKLF